MKLTHIPDTNTKCIVDDTTINKDSVAETSEKTFTPPSEKEVNQESACNVRCQTPSYTYSSMIQNSQAGEVGFDFCMISPSIYGKIEVLSVHQDTFRKIKGVILHHTTY